MNCLMALQTPVAASKFEIPTRQQSVKLYSIPPGTGLATPLQQGRPVVTSGNAKAPSDLDDLTCLGPA